MSLSGALEAREIHEHFNVERGCFRFDAPASPPKGASGIYWDENLQAPDVAGGALRLSGGANALPSLPRESIEGGRGAAHGPYPGALRLRPLNPEPRRASPAEVAFHAQRLSALDPSARLLGEDAGWTAPMTVVDAKDGFGRNNWVDVLPVSVLMAPLAGAALRSGWGTDPGRSSRRTLGVGFMPRGGPNHFTIEGPCRFAQIYVPDTLLADLAGRLAGETRSVTSQLPKDASLLHDAELLSRVGEVIRAGVSCATALEMEARIIVALEQLLRRSPPKGSPAAPGSGVLAPWRRPWRRGAEAP